MIVMFLLVLFSILIAAGFLAGFIWSVRSGQFEDTATPPMRLLLEDPPPRSAAVTFGRIPAVIAPARATLDPLLPARISAAQAAQTGLKIPSPGQPENQT
jgi:cbb3-type cytochrome oxidase maturation protein